MLKCPFTPYIWFLSHAWPVKIQISWHIHAIYNGRFLVRNNQTYKKKQCLSLSAGRGVTEYRYNPIYHSFNIAFNNTCDYCRSTIAFMSVHYDLDLQSTRRTNDILRCIHGDKGKYKYNFYFKL